MSCTCRNFKFGGLVFMIGGVMYAGFWVAYIRGPG